MASFSPDVVNRIVEVFRRGGESDSTVQAQIFQEISALEALPEYDSCLLYIFAHVDADSMTQQLAGLALKTRVLTNWNKLSPATIAYIKSELPRLIAHPNQHFSTTLGVIMSAILRRGGVTAWPQLLEILVSHLDSTDANTVIGALRALLIICEDVGAELDSPDAGRPIVTILPKLVPFMRVPNTRMQQLSLACINHCVSDVPTVLATCIDAYLAGLFALTSSESRQIRLLVCEAFVRLSETFIEHLQPHLDGVVQFIMHACLDLDDRVALAASEFWTAIAAQRLVCQQFVLPHLSALLPVLLRNMAYSEMELASLLNAARDDASVPDDPRDIRPHFVRLKQRGTSGSNASSTTATTANVNDDDGSDDDDDDGDDDAPQEVNWTLRMSSARGLDRLAKHFPDQLLADLLPLLTANLQSSNWLAVESAVLAIGAVASGCFMQMTAYLPELVPFLLRCLEHAQPLVRSIAAWSLARYSHWIVSQRDRAAFLEPVLQQFLRLAVDGHKKVQEAGISALATFEEAAVFELVPYLDAVVQTLVHAVTHYQARNLLIAYDAIGTLCEQLGDEMQQPNIVSALMPPLIERWRALADDAPELYALYECLTRCVLAMGTQIGDFAGPLLQRATTLAGTATQQILNYEAARAHARASQQAFDVEPPPTEPLVAALELISGVIEGLGDGAVNGLIDPRLAQIALAAAQTPLLDVRQDAAQAAFGVCGDLAVAAPAQLSGILEQLVPLLLHAVHPAFGGSCNNALWVLGTLAPLLGAQFAPVVEPLLQALVDILGDSAEPDMHAFTLHNAAACLSKVALGHPTLVAPRIGIFLNKWCRALRQMSSRDDKRTSFLGLCAAIEANPKDVAPHFIPVADAIASYENPPPDVRARLAALLYAFRDAYGENFNAYFNTWPLDVSVSCWCEVAI